MTLEELKNSPEYKRWDEGVESKADKYMLDDCYKNLVEKKPACTICGTECETFDEYGEVHVESFMTDIGVCIHCG